jgi:hypothetical protein
MIAIESLADLGAQAHADGLPCDYDAWAAPRDDSLHWTPCLERKKEWEHGWYSAAEAALHQRQALAEINAMWRECPHRWASYFGPVLMCQKCGATTMVAAAPGESKPIFAPRQASNAKDDPAGVPPSPQS